MAGLGEITPIKLQLSRENFNAMIGRHSQPIRWLSSDKCPNIKDNQKHDENCTYCKGNGVIYTNQTKSVRVEKLTAPIDGVIEKSSVEWVRDFAGNEYNVTAQGCVAYVDGVIKGRQYLVKYIEDVEKTGTGIAGYVIDGLYKISVPIEIQFGEVQGTLLSVSASVLGTPLTITEIYRNYFTVSDALQPTDQVDVEYTYIEPFQFALINNNFTKEDQKYLTDISGDGIMIFPQRWEVHENDVAIALNASTIDQQVIRSTGDIDTLNTFYVYEIKSAYSIRNGLKNEYVPGVDLIVHRGNQIRWITANKPNINESVSINYSSNLTYKVLKDMTNPRTSENNRFPRKVALQLMKGFKSREAF